MIATNCEKKLAVESLLSFGPVVQYIGPVVQCIGAVNVIPPIPVPVSSPIVQSGREVQLKLKIKY